MKTIKEQITQIVRASRKPVTLATLYAKIDAMKHSIRARLHYAARAGAVIAIGGGLYVAPGAQVGAVGDATVELKKLADAGAKFDSIFLDLPYATPGTVGGNRLISDFPTITPDQFVGICQQVARLLRTETSPAVFIFSSGESSKRGRAKYTAAIAGALTLAASGEYTKTYKNGKRCQIGGKVIPTEAVEFYTRSGKLEAEVDLDFTAVRPNRAYPTEKAVPFLQHIFSQAVGAGGVVLDPFGGSGSTSAACAQLGFASLSFDILHNPVEYWNSRKA